MSKYFGQMWGVRLALWLLAIGMSLGAWQWSVERYVRLQLSGRQLLKLEQAATLGVCPVLLSDWSEGLHAWDWRQDKRWRISSAPTDRTFLPIIRDGVTDRILFVDDRRTLVSVSVAASTNVERYSLPQEVQKSRVVGASQDGRFVALLGQDDTNYRFRLMELASRKITDAMDSPEELRATNRGQEFEIHYLGFRKDEKRNLLVKPIDPATLTKSERWKITDNGLFAPSTLAATISFDELDRGLTQQPRSLDGRYAVTMEADDRIALQEKGREVIVSVDCANHNSTAFSSDSRFLFVESAQRRHQVIDLETRAIVADDHFAERRTRFLNALSGVYGVLTIACLVLTVRAKAFEVAGFYYILAVAFADGALSALSTNDIGVPCYTSYGACLAIGLYWVWGEQQLLVRLLWGMAAQIGLVAATFSMHLSLVIDQGISPTSYTVDRLFGIAIGVPFVSSTSAVAAWLLYQLLGWRVGGNDSRASGRRYQLGLGTLFLATLVAAVSFASWRDYSSSATQNGSMLDLPPLIDGAAWVVWFFIINGLLTWVFAGLCFRHWSWRVIWIVGTIALLALIAFPIGIFAIPDMDTSWGEIAVVSSILPLLIVTCCFPLWLARRHGYRWVHAQTAEHPVIHAALPVPA